MIRLSFVKIVAVFCFVAVAFGCSEEEDDTRNANVFTGNNDTNQQECVGESESELCESAGFVCGEHEVTDECDETRQIDCGDPEAVCEEPETCGGGEEQGVCGCTPETDEELCAAEGVECGPFEGTVVDRCGEEREIDSCGDEEEVCGEFETCGGGEEEGMCGCTPETDEELCDAEGIECGPLQEAVDSCGEERTVESCGTEEEACGQFETCGGGGEEGVCGCTPETSEELCDVHNYECGPLEDITDSCGEQRAVASCGEESQVCTEEHKTCGGGEEPGQCGCTPTTCEAEGILCGTIDDQCAGELECDLFCAEQVAVGDQHACAVGSETIKCWGRNNTGQLGVGDTSNRENPAHVVKDNDEPLGDVASVTSGTFHSCALLNDETVRCWGWNDFGQLGDGSTNDSTTPTSLAIFEGAQKIDAGERHTCAVVEEEPTVHRVKCWGHNSHGQIGDPDIDLGNTVSTPREIKDATGALDDYNALDIRVGERHSCALFRGPFQDKPFDESQETGLNDEVWCWGDNRFGQSAPEVLEPNYPGPTTAFGIDLDDVPGLPVARYPTPGFERSSDAPGTLHLTAGADHTCIHDDHEEQTFCMGTFAVDDAQCPVELEIYDGEDEEEGPQYTSVERNANYCGIFPDRDRYPGLFPLIGYTGDEDGHSLQTVYLDKAMDGTTWFEVSDSPDISSSDLSSFSSLSAASGSNHFCAIAEHDGTTHSNVYCMGANRSGQLGDGTNNNWSDTQEVLRDVDDNFVNAVQISLGRDMSCALLENKNIQCWGSNAQGQIGNSDLQEDESLRPFNVRLPIAE